jgi:hypothetical protein
MKAAHVGKAAEKVRSSRLETIRRIQQLAREVSTEFVSSPVILLKTMALAGNWSGRSATCLVASIAPFT